MASERTPAQNRSVANVPATALEQGLAHVRAAPTDAGRVELIVRRPAVDERELLEEARLDPAHGVVGDTWRARPTTSTPDRTPHPDKQVTVMNARLAALVAGDERNGWAQAGDQLYLDLDISHANLPAGTRLRLGSAVLEVTAQPHLGCHKFRARFGADAVRFVNSKEGRALRLRGMNTRVVTAGTVRVGDRVTVERSSAERPSVVEAGPGLERMR
jgi:MOSC domain-containing protein YiiM